MVNRCVTGAAAHVPNGPTPNDNYDYQTLAHTRPTPTRRWGTRRALYMVVVRTYGHACGLQRAWTPVWVGRSTTHVWWGTGGCTGG